MEEVKRKKDKTRDFEWEPFEEYTTEKKDVSVSYFISQATKRKIIYIKALLRRRILTASHAKILLSLLKQKSNALLGYKVTELKEIGFSDSTLSRIHMLIRPAGETVESICDTLDTDDTRIINAITELKDHLYTVSEDGTVGCITMSATGYDDIHAAADAIRNNTDLTDWANRRYKESSNHGGGDGPSDPPGNEVRRHLKKAIDLYGLFKAVKTEEIVINDETIFFDSRHPRLFLLYQYENYIPSLLLVCLYAIHYALRSNWDTCRASDKDKFALLKAAILTLKPQYEDYLKRLTEQLDKITSDMMKEKKDRIVTEFVDIDVPDDFELIVIDKSPLVSSMLSDRTMQYRLCWVLENKVCPEIYSTKRWTWAMLRSAMVLVGLFSGTNGTERGKDVVSDGKFAKCLLSFISKNDIDNHSINYDSLRVATGRKNDCDSHKDSADYKMVLEVADMLNKYKLGAPTFVDEV